MSRGPRKLLSRPERQEAILRGAARAFAWSGFAGTSVDDVAHASGITPVIVYRHFESKAALYQSVLERTFKKMAEELQRTLGTQRESLAEAGLLTVLRVGREDPDGLRLLLLHAPREPEFAQYAERTRRIVVDGLARNRRGDPVFGPWAVEVAVSHVFDAVLTWLDVGDPERDDEFVARAARGVQGLVRGWLEPYEPADDLASRPASQAGQPGRRQKRPHDQTRERDTA